MASRRAPKSSRTAPVQPTSTYRPWLLAIVLAAVTLLAYQPAWHGGMLWDDDAHLTTAALASWHGLLRIWTDFTVTQQYYPVVNSAFWVMNRLWAHDTLGYHIVNILLHAMSAWIVAGMLRRWSVPGAIVAAVIFALHPVHVESVAWMTELKNTLSGVFYLLAFAAYLRFDDTRRGVWYAAATVALVLALASKTVTATLPAALLIVMWWRRGSLDWRRDLLPLVPLFAVGAVAGLGTAWLEYAWVGAKGETFDLSILERCLLAGRAAWFYAAKLVWPFGLIFSYPKWSIDQAVWWQYLFPLALAGVLVWLWIIRRRTRAPLAAVLFFLVTLAPALGFINVFPFKYSYVADHFQYLASLGPIALIAAGLTQLALRWRPRMPVATIAIAAGAPLFALTFLQSRQYMDAETLYRATLDRNPQALLARTNLAALLLTGPESGWAEAIKQAQAAIAIDPRDAEAHNTLGFGWQKFGQIGEAAREHQEAVRLKPDLAEAQYNLGLTMDALGRLDEAVAAYEASLRAFPNQPGALHNLANVLAKQGRVDDALLRRRQAANLAPESFEIHMNLGNALLAKGEFRDAIIIYGDAIKLRPDSGEAYHNLGTALRRVGKNAEAVGAFEQAARLMPGVAVVEINLGSALVAVNRLQDAVPHFERALATTDPGRAPDIHVQLGIVLAQLGQKDAAIAHLETALKLRPGDRAILENLARIKRGPAEPAEPGGPAGPAEPAEPAGPAGPIQSKTPPVVPL